MKNFLQSTIDVCHSLLASVLLCMLGTLGIVTLIFAKVVMCLIGKSKTQAMRLKNRDFDIQYLKEDLQSAREECRQLRRDKKMLELKLSKLSKKDAPLTILKFPQNPQNN